MLHYSVVPLANISLVGHYANRIPLILGNAFYLILCRFAIMEQHFIRRSGKASPDRQNDTVLTFLFHLSDGLSNNICSSLKWLINKKSILSVDSTFD